MRDDTHISITGNVTAGAIEAAASVEGVSLAESDAAFLAAATEANYAEIASARIARTRSSSLEVRTLAARLQRDHERSFGELRALASAKQVPIASALAMEKAVRAHTTFGMLTGTALEDAWLDLMITDHRVDIEVFQKAAYSVDPDISEFAERTLPGLKSHLKALEAVKNHLGR